MHLQKPVSFFWETSYACNLECRHCYTNSSQYVDVPTDWAQAKAFIDNMRSMGMFTFAIGGGEPMLLPFLYDMIRYSVDMELGVSITSNGTLIGRQEARQLKESGLDIAQISIDGLEEIHDWIRGKGVFQKAIEATKYLIEEGIAVRFGVTVNKVNYHEIPDIIMLAKSLGVEVVAFFRYMPSSLRGDGLELDEQSLYEAAELLVECDKNSVKVAKDGKRKFYLIYTPTSFLTFLLNDGDLKNTICTAGIGKFNVQADGTVTPCSHMPMPMGNIFNEDEVEIWSRFKTIQNDINLIPDGCKECMYGTSCRGGCKGISYIKYGNLCHKDEACFIDLIARR